jgi:uncharacterized protein (DUF697 family)
MSTLKLAGQVRQALSNLNPTEVRAIADQPVAIELVAPTPEVYLEMESLLIPPGTTPEKRAEARSFIVPPGSQAAPSTIRIYEDTMAHPEDAFLYDPSDPSRVLKEIMAARKNLHVPLARRFPGFRGCVAPEIVRNISGENALFALATAIPNVIPFFSLPFAAGEFASDLAFLTMNQVRMAFLLAGASGREVGYGPQKKEIASIVGGAFGWRTLARELVGKIPLGGGILPKAGIAYAGTYVVGASIERYYRLGYGYSKSERDAAYKKAFEKGKSIASAMLEAYRDRKPKLEKS